MLDQQTGRSPLVYALMQDMARQPNYGQSGAGGLGGLGGVPLGSLLKLFAQQQGANPALTPDVSQPAALPTPGASAVG